MGVGGWVGCVSGGVGVDHVFRVLLEALCCRSNYLALCVVHMV